MPQGATELTRVDGVKTISRISMNAAVSKTSALNERIKR